MNMSADGVDNRIVIVGPGAMGCLYAALLTEGGGEVALLDYRRERAAEIARQGVILVEQEQERTVHVPCQAEAELLGSAALVVILTKAYDTLAATQHSAALVGESTAVLTLQNGLGNYQQIADCIPLAQMLAGATTAGATLLDTGKVKVAARGEIALGSPAGDEELAQQVAGILSSAGLVARTETDVDALLWRKALVNAAINPLTALTHRRNGELLDNADLRQLLRMVAEETYEVGSQLGIGWGHFDPYALVEQVCERTASNKSSMLQDVEAGRRTETDSINGYIAHQAQQAGLAAPLNEALTALVRAQATV